MTEMRDRNRAIFEARLGGKTFRTIADEHEISIERARHVFVRECRRTGYTQVSNRRSPGMGQRPGQAAGLECET